MHCTACFCSAEEVIDPALFARIFSFHKGFSPLPFYLVLLDDWMFCDRCKQKRSNASQWCLWWNKHYSNPIFSSRFFTEERHWILALCLRRKIRFRTGLKLSSQWRLPTSLLRIDYALCGDVTNINPGMRVSSPSMESKIAQVDLTLQSSISLALIYQSSLSSTTSVWAANMVA